MWEFRLRRFREMSVNIVCEAYADWRTFSTNCAMIDNEFYETTKPYVNRDSWHLTNQVVSDIMFAVLKE